LIKGDLNQLVVNGTEPGLYRKARRFVKPFPATLILELALERD
jgi:hypothetical protein